MYLMVLICKVVINQHFFFFFIQTILHKTKHENLKKGRLKEYYGCGIFLILNAQLFTVCLERHWSGAVVKDDLFSIEQIFKL